MATNSGNREGGTREYHPVSYKNRQIASWEPELLELVKLLGINIPRDVVRLLLQLLEEGIAPQVAYNLYKKLMLTRSDNDDIPST